MKETTEDESSIRYCGLTPRFSWQEIQERLNITVPSNLVYELNVHEADPLVLGNQLDVYLFVGTKLDTSKTYISNKSFDGTSVALGESLNKWMNSELILAKEDFIE